MIIDIMIIVITQRIMVWYHYQLVVQLGLKLNTKLGLDHPPPTHPPPTTTNFSKGSSLGRRLRFYKQASLIF